MQRDYYYQYFHLERNNWWFLVRFKIIRQTIKKYVYKGTPLKILNIGVATGAGSDMLSVFGNVISSEYDEETCQFLRDELKIDVTQASVTALPFADNTFDLVCAFDVIEHVEDDIQAYAEMKRVCKNGGHIAVTVPAFMMMWSGHDVINHHFRRYKKEGILKLLSHHHLKTKYSSYFNTILFLPVLLIRLAKNAQGKNEIPQSDFQTNTHPWINTTLKTIFSVELFLLKLVSLPFGVSYFNISEKED
jgi:ubiquinone/menaquinone biosynthesis C-methylase UbiE